MINRFILKQKAKSALQNNYWICAAVCVIVSAITQLVPQFTYRLNFFNHETNLTEYMLYPEKIALLSAGAMILVICIFILNIAFSIFLFSPLNVGKNKFFIQSANGNSNIKSILEIFTSTDYMNVVKTLFIRDIRLILWSLFYIIPMFVFTVLGYVNNDLLFLVPLSAFGIIPYIMKYYSYFMTDYILAQNPEMNYKKCLDLSSKMMKGCRFSVFKLQLSFLGWIILGAMLCGIGLMFVYPYIEATMVQLYFDRKNAVNSYGFCYEE